MHISGTLSFKLASAGADLRAASTGTGASAATAWATAAWHLATMPPAASLLSPKGQQAGNGVAHQPVDRA